VRMLGEIKDPVALPFLEKLLTISLDSYLDAVTALGIIGRPAIPILKAKVLGPNNWHVKTAAVRALGQIEGRETVFTLEELKDLAGFGRLDLAVAVIEELGKTGATAVPVLENLFSYDAWDAYNPSQQYGNNNIAKKAVVRALGRIGGREAVLALEKILFCKYIAVQQQAAEAILDIWPDNKELCLKAQFVVEITIRGLNAVMPELETALSHADPAIQAAARRVLGEYKPILPPILK